MSRALLARLDRQLLSGRPDGVSPLSWRCFQLGLLLLASSALLAGLLLLVPLLLGSRHRRPPLADRANWPLLAAAVGGRTEGQAQSATAALARLGLSSGALVAADPPMP